MNFKSVILLLACFWATYMIYGLPVPDEPIELERYKNKIEGNMTILSYKLSDGTLVISKTFPEIVNGEEVTVHEGRYVFYGTDNKWHVTLYRADQKGYRSKYLLLNESLEGIEDNIDPKVLASLLG